MPAISAHYPGKIILFGEHAVVYHSQAIAIPVNRVQSRAVITPLIGEPQSKIIVYAPDIHLSATLDTLPPENPVAAAIRLTLQRLGLQVTLPFEVRVTSDIPIAAGLGSGASVTCAIASAISSFLGIPLNAKGISEIAFEIEKLHHGTPSGVDNTVIAYRRPVVFQRGGAIEPLMVGAKMEFIIADTGIKARTGEVVGGVRARWQADQPYYETRFDAIQQVVSTAREAIRSGDIAGTGLLMIENHRLLKEIGVSHSALDLLVTAATEAGAYGAKLSGAGAGGNMIALVDGRNADFIEQKLLTTGAVRVIRTSLEANLNG